jgi:hypothetical protein
MRKPFQQYIIQCIVCGESFMARRAHAKTCRKSTCRVILHREKVKYREPADVLSDITSEAQNQKAQSHKICQEETSVRTENIDADSSCEYKYCINATPFGCVFNFFGYTGALFNISSDWELIKCFESHLVKHELYPTLAKPDKNKVAAFKILLENRRFIADLVTCPGEGLNIYKGKILLNDRTIEPPHFEYHV